MTTSTSSVRIEPTHKWVRGYRNGRVVVDSRSVQLVWTHPHYPTWFFPAGDVDAGFATERADAISSRTDLPDHLADHVTIEWDAADQWFEEEVEVFVHPRSPYTRIDALPSSRHVVVSLDGTVVADSQRPTILYETGLPPRYYLPPTDVRLDLLTPTDKSTACPYKGTAVYWSATVGGVEHPDIAWAYPTPLPESQPIAGMLCFYNHRVDLTIT
jgi:uncharacterized protein (DUF427 family)